MFDDISAAVQATVIEHIGEFGSKGAAAGVTA
jgi:hypothetical protein